MCSNRLRRPKNEVFIASRAEEKPPQEIALEYDSTEATREIRPSGRRFGTLVHAVMRDVAYEADDAAIATFVALHGRILGGSEEECAAAQSAVSLPIHYWRAHDAVRRHREYPVVLPLEGGKLLEGVVDLAFAENGEWVVVDFKTDANVTARRVPYDANCVLVRIRADETHGDAG